VARSIAPNLNQDLRDTLGQIKCGPCVSTVFLTNETRPQIWDNTYTTPKRALKALINMSITMRVEELSRRLGSSIMAFPLAAGLARELTDLEDAEILSRCNRDQNEIFPRLESLVEEVHVKRWRDGLATAAGCRLS
jgi:oxygen-dependent protoporphyrinogen oxidase